MSREDRRLLNIKQDSISEIDYYPSSQNVPEGDMIISHPKGKTLRLYKKLKGMLWWNDFTKDGNKTIENNLEVRGNTVLNPKVGIGTNEPAQVLHIEHPSLDTVVRIGAPTNKTTAIQFHSDGGDYTWQMGVPYNADRFVIDESSISSGNDLVVYTGGIVLIGRSSPVVTTKDPKLEVDALIASDGYMTRAGTGDSDRDEDNFFNVWWTGSAGDIYIDTTEMDLDFAVSDYRFKKDIQNIPDGVLEKIESLRPITYTQKEFDIFTETDEPKSSLIAHELQEVFPYVVNGKKDEIKEDGNPKIQSINTLGLISYLVKAVQELSAKVTALENN